MTELEILKNRLFKTNNVQNVKFSVGDTDVTSEDVARQMNKFFADMESSTEAAK